MDSMAAFGMAKSAAARGAKFMVFDWDKAAQLIKERKPKEASAGLRSDWEYTGGTIYTADEGPAKSSYTYLASNWATPELDLDGEIIPCFVYEDEETNPNKWNEHTLWPETALAILNSNE
jgi:ATP:corrinoid adenosyltransferase